LKSSLIGKETAYVLVKRLFGFVYSDELYAFGTRVFHFFYGIYALFKYGDPDFFWSIAIETSTYCNRNCYYCPNSVNPLPREWMPEELFQRIIGNLRDIGYSGSVSYQTYGEPLLDERLVDLVRYSRQNLPRGVFLKVLSNGDFLTMELFESLIEAGMNEIHVTLHDMDPSAAMKRLQPLIDRHPSHIRANPIHGSRYLTNRGGAIELDVPSRIRRCFYLGTAVINRKGDMLLCCNDYFQTHVFGNVMNKSIEEIWKGTEFKRVRRQAWKGRPVLEICRRCLSVDDGFQT